MINYDHSENLHTTHAPECIVQLLLKDHDVQSVLDIGCGTGVWLNQFSQNGIKDIYGIDGIDIGSRIYFADKKKFQRLDLRNKWDLGRTFDLAVCLEVAEHLPGKSAAVLVEMLCKHANLVLFSAACPSQGGQGHVNCQWPQYWQQLFNDNGFYCEDSLRPRIWNEAFPEFWYKQNIFIASMDKDKAGKERRMLSTVHPELFQWWVSSSQNYESLLEGRQGLRKSLNYALGMTAKSVRDAFSRRVFQGSGCRDRQHDFY